MLLRRPAVLILLITFTACVTPPAPPQPRTATEVNAGVGKAWDAAIDIFAERNIQIKTLDRSSGLIVAEPSNVGATTNAAELADCGKDMGMALAPTAATWNLLVRGDSSRSTAKATVRFVRTGTFGLSTTPETRDCSTRGVWESDFEHEVKQRAEAKK